MEIDFRKINCTPVFVAYDTSQVWNRAYGASFLKDEGAWVFPAFPPFISKVLFDLPCIDKNITFTQAALDWQASLKTMDEWLEYTNTLSLPKTSYTHQLRGLAELLYNYRWILRWKTGTGKTKPVVDAITQLRCKTLILCPLIAVDVWVNKSKEYSGDTLNALALQGGKKQKLEAIKTSAGADVLITTFDFAQRHGIPKLLPKTVQVFKDSQRIPHQGVIEALRKLNDDKEQARLAKEWIEGRKPASIEQEVTELIGDDLQWIVNYPYETIVADESHRLKNPSSKRTKLCTQLSRKAARRYLLTATLSQGNPWDIYAQGKFLAPYFIPEDYRAFEKTYMVTTPQKVGKFERNLVVGYKNLHILNARVVDISSEQLLEDCVDMPERSFESIYFDLTGKQINEYNQLVENMEIRQPNASPITVANAATRLSKLLQICSGFMYLPVDTEVCNDCINVMQCVENNVRPGTGRCIHRFKTKDVQRYTPNPKLDALEDKLEDLVTSGKTIIWAMFAEELNIIEEMLQKNNWGYVRVDGSTTKNIKQIETKFNTDPECLIYLGQIHTGIAVTLNTAAYMIYFSRNWSPDDRTQSLGRNYRLGQNQKTVVYDLCSHKTVEGRQLAALQNKDDVADLLTRRINCLVCAKYKDCRGNNVTPWSPTCILHTIVKRSVTHAKAI